VCRSNHCDGNQGQHGFSFVERVHCAIMNIELNFNVFCSCSDCTELWLWALLCLKELHFEISLYDYSLFGYGRITEFPSCFIMIFLYKRYLQYIARITGSDAHVTLRVLQIWALVIFCFKTILHLVSY
jgi:hypothetical protein